MTPIRHPQADAFGYTGTRLEFFYRCEGWRCQGRRTFLTDPNPGFDVCPDCRPFCGPPEPLPSPPVSTRPIPTDDDRTWAAVRASRMAFAEIDPQWEAWD